MKKQAYGVIRSRDRKGKIVHQELKPYTMCIHTYVGGGYESMSVLVAEVIRYETEDSSSHKERVYRMRRERLLRLDLPHSQVKERKSARGGAYLPYVDARTIGYLRF